MHSEAWCIFIAAREPKIATLPVHHFLVTFTVPVQVRSVLRHSQRKAYGAMFDAGSQTILDLAAGSKYLSGCRIGFWGMFHTWRRDPMVYHPHVHFVVPGGGLHEDGSRWQQTPTNFLFPHAAMVTVYKAKLADQLRECGLYEEIPTDAWHAKFVVDIKPVGDGQAVLKYLAPYVHRVAISDHRITACDDSSVTFRYTPSGTKRAPKPAPFPDLSSYAASCNTRCRLVSRRSATTPG